MQIRDKLEKNVSCEIAIRYANYSDAYCDY